MTVHPNEYRGLNLVFIVGAPRSGTTWLQRLLASHPLVKTGQESRLFRAYLAPQLKAWHWEMDREADPSSATGREGAGLSCYLGEEEFMSILRDYMMRLLRPMVDRLADGELFLEKTPAHALCLDEMNELLPECRVIHVLRDGRDVVASLLAASRSWGAGWAPNAARSAAGMWVQHVRAARRSRQRFSSERFCEVRYEDLCTSTHQTLMGLIEFLGLEWSHEQIEAAIRANDAQSLKAAGGTPIMVGGRTARAAGVNMRELKEPQGFVRNARPGGWKRDLSLLEKVVTWKIIRRTMTEVGYPWPTPFSASSSYMPVAVGVSSRA